MKVETKIAIVEQTLLTNYNKYYKIAFLYVQNETDAVDVVQESAYKAIYKANLLKKTEYTDTWIYRIVVNEAKNFIKKNRKNHSNFDDLSIPYMDIYENIDLKKSLKLLGEPEKSIVILRFFDDLKVEDIASILNISVNTTKSKLYRSLKKLQRFMEVKDEKRLIEKSREVSEKFEKTV